MCIKIPQQDFALIMQRGGGELMCEGGCICGSLWYLIITRDKICV